MPNAAASGSSIKNACFSLLAKFGKEVPLFELFLPLKGFHISVYSDY